MASTLTKGPKRKRTRKGIAGKAAAAGRKTLPSTRTRGRWKRWRRRWKSWPTFLRAALATAVIVIVWGGVNGIYQVVHKPSELFFPVSGSFYKTPTQTWRTYGRHFEKHATETITAELLAALAQVEGSGNPIVRTYWRWSLRADPFEVYRPASSAVGMYQITDSTFDEARRLCIHRHVVVEVGAWHDVRSCWFNSLYTRTVASHAIEMTSAHLDRSAARALARHGMVSAPLADRQKLAALIHLCGAGAGTAFVRTGFRVKPGQRCGDHDLGGYLTKVDAMRVAFRRLADD